MEKKCLAIFLFIVIMCLMLTDSYAGKNKDIFNKIIQKKYGTIEEYGTKISFLTSGNMEDTCLKIFRKLKLNNGNLSVTKDKNYYRIDFENSFSGYIEGQTYQNKNVITINILRKSKDYKLNQIQKYIENMVNGNSKLKSSKYVKIKLNDKYNLNSINNQILGMLRDNNSKNIKTVKIKNGFDSVAYTGIYDPLLDNGKYIDFNYAACRYNSGNYIIMGTPEIYISY